MIEDLSQSAISLIEKQKAKWPLMAGNYADLKHVKFRTIKFDGFKIKIQYNPARIISSSAKVDSKSIHQRPCFLCALNRPEEQMELPFEKKYLILVNPFPIFPQHLTISHRNHTIQEIQPCFMDLLTLAKVLTRFTLFYNGPRCGASAPDHLHFQAGNKGFMPLDSELSQIKKRYGSPLSPYPKHLFRVDDGIRRFFVMESSDKILLERIFQNLYKQLQQDATKEPDLNIHTSHDGKVFRVIVFPRGAHRPWQYFEKGEKNILLSPASVDLGGVLITPLEKDFLKISSKNIIDILGQVGISEKDFLSIKPA